MMIGIIRQPPHPCRNSALPFANSIWAFSYSESLSAFTRSGFFRHLLLGRFPSFSQPVVRPLYQHLPLASCQRPVQQCAGENPGADATEGYRAAFRSGFHPRQFKRGLHHFPHYRHHRVFHHTDRIKLDCAGRRRCRQLPQECEPKGIPGRFPGGWYGRSSGGKHCRKAYQIITV